MSKIWMYSRRGKRWDSSVWSK